MTETNDSNDNRATCGQCRHYQPVAGGHSGFCNGLPPTVVASGFQMECKVGFNRPSCSLFKRNGACPVCEMTTEQLKAEAPALVKAALEDGRARVTGVPAPKWSQGPKNKKAMARV